MHLGCAEDSAAANRQVSQDTDSGNNIGGTEGTAELNGKPGVFSILHVLPHPAPRAGSHSYPFILPMGRNSTTVLMIPARSTNSIISEIFLEVNPDGLSEIVWSRILQTGS
jgi:hypothetical protein